jgi:hypothetical protein
MGGTSSSSSAAVTQRRAAALNAELQKQGVLNLLTAGQREHLEARAGGPHHARVTQSFASSAQLAGLSGTQLDKIENSATPARRPRRDLTCGARHVGHQLSAARERAPLEHRLTHSSRVFLQVRRLQQRHRAWSPEPCAQVRLLHSASGRPLSTSRSPGLSAPAAGRSSNRTPDPQGPGS